VFQVNAIEPDGLEGTLSLPADLHRLQEIIREHDVALVILDPLLTLVHKGLDTHKDAEVRRALEPVVRMAHDTKTSLIGLVHVNKSTEGDLLNRIMASKALTAVPRGFLFCAKYTPKASAEGKDDPGEPPPPRNEFVLGQIKNNLAAKVMISLRYHMETEIVGYDDEADKEIRASMLIISDHSVAQNIEDIVLEQEKARKGVKTQGVKAKQWLIGYLTGKGEVPSTQVISDGEAAGHARNTIQRARSSLEGRVAVRSFGMPKTTTWQLLEEERDD
jgi:AAA domain